jgi:hypothetical protein
MKKTKAISGQTLVEFALLLPLFLFIVMALFEIGRAVLYFSVLNTAVREGTRTAVVQPSRDYVVGSYNEGDGVTVTCETYVSNAHETICNAITEKLFNIGELQNSTITIQHFNNGGTNPTEFYVRIVISFNFSPIVPGLNLIGSFPINVRSQMLKTPLSRP